MMNSTPKASPSRPRRKHALPKIAQGVRIRCFLILLVVLLSCVPSMVSSSSVSSIPERRGSWTPFKKKETVESTTASVPCDGRAVVPTQHQRKACGFYVWDFPSALLYKWCHYLLRDKIYEGMGGHLFVRYESNSILKLLYPCSRYSPNKCMICGGSYPDHLELWWSKHLYSPYDRYLDKTYNDALSITAEEEDSVKTPRRKRKRINNNNNNNNNNQRRASVDRNRTPTIRTRNKSRNKNRRSLANNSAPSTPVQTLTDPPTFGFHRKYVEDISHMYSGIKDRDRMTRRDPREMIKMVRKQLPASKQRDIIIPSEDVLYLAPNLGGRTGVTSGYTEKEAIIDILSMLLHSCIDSTISLQHREFSNRKQKNSRVSNRL